jgi:DNA topoisomerase-1
MNQYQFTKLVIVESPSKCKKIEEYLGFQYKCVATCGHIRELIFESIKNEITPKYEILNTSFIKNQINIIKNLISMSSEVIIGTDDDREGEAIGWHICEVFGLNIATTKRILFHEITEFALKHAIQNPQFIDMNIVNSQQTRQILDLIIGYNITPTLWNYITTSNSNLSAGRCQSPALKLVYDNEMDMKKHPGKLTYSIVGYFTKMCIPYYLETDVDTKHDVLDFLKNSISFNHVFTKQPSKIIMYENPEPLSTSKLLQHSNSQFGYSPKDTMAICQKLYESGYITYMRTSSTQYSVSFLLQATKYINDVYGEEYIGNLDLICCKLHDNTHSHEAIRPTDLNVKDLPKSIGTKESKIYKLIFTHTVETCMKPAIYLSITSKITAPNDRTYHATHESPQFLGWKRVRHIEVKTPNKYNYIVSLPTESILQYKNISATMILRESRSRYTEANIINLLEINNIGRPSTYASIVDKIQDRGYVKKENITTPPILCSNYELVDGDIIARETNMEFGNGKNKLVIQPIGVSVIEFLNTHFQSFIDYDFSKSMEFELDKITEGGVDWVNLCDQCNIKIKNGIQLLTGIPGIHSNKKMGKDEKRLGVHNEKEVILKKGKFGLYVIYGEETKNVPFGNRPLENICLEEVIPLLNTTKNENELIVRNISDNINIRKNKNGTQDYIYFRTTKMKKPSFFSLTKCNLDYNTCDIQVLKCWIRETYNIY